MKKINAKKLSVSSTTIRNLSGSELGTVAGPELSGAALTGAPSADWIDRSEGNAIEGGTIMGSGQVTRLEETPLERGAPGSGKLPPRAVTGSTGTDG